LGGGQAACRAVAPISAQLLLCLRCQIAPSAKCARSACTRSLPRCVQSGQRDVCASSVVRAPSGTRRTRSHIHTHQCAASTAVNSSVSSASERSHFSSTSARSTVSTYAERRLVPSPAVERHARRAWAARHAGHTHWLLLLPPRSLAAHNCCGRSRSRARHLRTKCSQRTQKRKNARPAAQNVAGVWMETAQRKRTDFGQLERGKCERRVVNSDRARW
jgi:hypothetical protein